MDYPQVITETPLGAPILLADGNIELRVEAKADPVLACRVVVGGVLRSQVGINFPMHSPKVSAFTDKDREDLRFGIAQGVDFVAMSSVGSAQDILEAQEFIRSLGADIPIIAKIEKHEALGHSPRSWRWPTASWWPGATWAWRCPWSRFPCSRSRSSPRPTAGQAGDHRHPDAPLHGRDHSRPSRAEVTDVANAILDGTDAVMLSEETAAGQYPVEAVKFLDRVSRVTEEIFPTPPGSGPGLRRPPGDFPRPSAMRPARWPWTWRPPPSSPTPNVAAPPA